MFSKIKADGTCTAQLEETEYRVVAKYSALGKKERVSISDTGNTRWFEYFIDGEPVGCCGLIKQGNKSRIKGVYILPQYRGKGYGQFMDDCLAEVALDNGSEILEVLTLHPSFYERRGFTIIKETRKGVYLSRRKL